MLKEKKIGTKGWLKRILFVLLGCLSVLTITAAIWEAKNWNDLNMHEVVNQLATPIQGTEAGILHGFINGCLIPTLIAAVLLIVLLILLRKWDKLNRTLNFADAVLGVIFVGMIVYGCILLDVVGFISDSVVSSNFIEENYVDPKKVSITFPEKKRNLIYIWLESMESTYADEASGGAFSVNVIPELTRLANENENFTGEQGGVNGGYSTAGSTWTMGALFAQTSGLPLKIPVTESSMSLQTVFFPGATALGDILAENGYRQAFLIGSRGGFGGRQLYFQTHGDYEIWDHGYSVEQGEIPEDYYVWWGYEDHRLLINARKHLQELAASDQPFNLSILTVDTHFPDGYVCDYCGDQYGDDQYSNVMACSDREISEFIAWIQEQPFYENTTIVISGDHTTMDVDYCDSISEDYQRRVFATVINAPVEPETSRYRIYTTMDMYPTTLAALGVQIEGDRLGLGTNLYSKRSTLVEQYGLAELNRNLKRRSDFMKELSGLDPEVYELAENLRTTDVELEMEIHGSSITYTAHNLGSFTEFDNVYVFAEVITGNTRSTIVMCAAERMGDDFVAEMPFDQLRGLRTYTVNLYTSTEAGRFKIGSGYTCDLDAGTLETIESEY